MTSSIHSSLAHLRIQAYRVKTHQKECHAYAAAHKEDLKKLQITNLSSFDTSWMDLEKCVIITASDMRNPEELLAGIRIEPWLDHNTLPIEKVLEKFPEIPKDAVLHPKHRNNLAEVCGLWVNSSAPGLGRIITRAAFSIFPQLNIEKSIAMVSQNTARTAQLMGYKTITASGLDRGIAYPTADFTSFIMHHKNTLTLETAHLKERIIIQELIKNIQNKWCEPLNNTKFRIHYHLKL